MVLHPGSPSIDKKSAERRNNRNTVANRGNFILQDRYAAI
jgi:hypothetical protein